MYAIGGSENPMINSEGNRFFAPDARFKKEVMLAIIFEIISGKQVPYHPVRVLMIWLAVTMKFLSISHEYNTAASFFFEYLLSILLI